MGLLVEGQWHTDWYDTKATGGNLSGKDHISVTGLLQMENQASGHWGFKAEPSRYHLYVSLACPWAHRTLIFRS